MCPTLADELQECHNRFVLSVLTACDSKTRGLINCHTKKSPTMSGIF
ncbi:hypothetical protein HYV22_04395 [Candidatus Gottesmanbacteria bacterium]|nr:hypothetical protein [Candidatus Gottesmanbacteria bacterium]